MLCAKSLVHILLLLSLGQLFLADPAGALSREEKSAVTANPAGKPGAAPFAPAPGGALPARKKPANGKEKLAVLDLDRSGVESDLAFSMSVVLRDELFALGDYEVLSREDLLALAKRLSIQQQAGDECADDQCLVSYGRSLGTRFMVAGVLSKVGNTYSVSLRLLDTEGETGGVINRVYERCKCSQDELFDTVATAAAKLMNKRVAAIAASAQPVLPPTPPEPSAPAGQAELAPVAALVVPVKPAALPAPPAPRAAALPPRTALPSLPGKPSALPAPPAPPAPQALAAAIKPGAPIIPAAPTVTIAAATVAASAAGKNFADSFTGMEFVPVPGGCFQMGDTFGDGKSDELPVHEVCLSPFAIGKYEVTQGQWQKVMGKNPSLFPKGDNYPVENVTWEDTQKFISKLNQKSGRNYRLPTEAEWEYAARSGGKREKFAGGSEVDEVAWHEQNSGFSPRAAGTKAANGLGIYDMSGNVWEWCLDWRNNNYYASSPRHNPSGPASGPYHSVRGGSWNDTLFQARATNRYRGTPATSGFMDFRCISLGFRLVLPLGK